MEKARLAAAAAAKPRKRRAEASMLRGLGFDPVVSSVWLYHQDQMTQNEIAALLGVSRPTVVNYLNEGLRRALVRVLMDDQCLRMVSFARNLCDRYGLTDCLVIPDDGGARHPAQRIGEAGAMFLSRELTAGDRLGVAWGATVMALAGAMPPIAFPDVQVVQMMGSMTARSAFAPELCVSNIATRIGGQARHLHAPIFVSSAEVCATFLREPVIDEQFQLIRACNRVVYGVSGLNHDGTIFASGLVTPEEMQPYVRDGAIGTLFGSFIDAAGRPVSGPFDGRLVGPTLENVAQVGQRLCVAGGPTKVEALNAVMSVGLTTHLVTDENTAAAVLSRYA